VHSYRKWPKTFWSVRAERLGDEIALTLRQLIGLGFKLGLAEALCGGTLGTFGLRTVSMSHLWWSTVEREEAMSKTML